MLTDEQVDALIISLCGEGVDLREGRAIFRAGMLEERRQAMEIIRLIPGMTTSTLGQIEAAMDLRG